MLTDGRASELLTLYLSGIGGVGFHTLRHQKQSAMKCLCLCLLRFVSPRLLRIKKFVASKVLINITIKRRTSRVQFKAIPGASSSRVPRGTTPGGCMMDAPLSQLQSLVLPRHHHQPQHLMHLHHGPSLDAILPLHVEHPIWLACRSHFVLPNGQ